MCMFVCVLPPSNPTTSSPLSLSPSPLKCHAVLSTHLTFYPPNKPFVWHREEALRLGEKDRRGGWGWGEERAAVVDWLSRTSGSTSLTSEEPGCFQKRSTFHSSLLSSPLSPPNHHNDPILISTHNNDLCRFFPPSRSYLLLC